MSKKRNKQQQKKPQQNKQQGKKKFPWPMVVLGGLLLIAAAFYLANRPGTGKHGSGPPKIAVDQQKIDYGDVRYGTDKSFDIKVTNIGGAVLRFNQEPYIEVLAGC
jgi:hypothetical protein